MSKLVCKCGQIMWNGNTPNDVELWVYTDKQLCTILEQDNITTLELANLYNYDVWCCPVCKRIYVFDKQGYGIKPKYIYKLEKD